MPQPPDKEKEKKDKPDIKKKPGQDDGPGADQSTNTPDLRTVANQFITSRTTSGMNTSTRISHHFSAKWKGMKSNNADEEGNNTRGGQGTYKKPGKHIP